MSKKRGLLWMFVAVLSLSGMLSCGDKGVSYEAFCDYVTSCRIDEFETDAEYDAEFQQCIAKQTQLDSEARRAGCKDVIKAFRKCMYELPCDVYKYGKKLESELYEYCYNESVDFSICALEYSKKR